MCGKSIYKKLKSDFNVVENYGFDFSHDSKHNIRPAIVFTKNSVAIQVGFDYGKHRFYIYLSDSTKKIYPSEEVLVRIKAIDPERFDFFKDGIPETNDILEDTVLAGDSYKDQVDQVRKFLYDYLETHKGSF